MREIEVSFKSNAIDLAGTLTIPKNVNRPPMVLMVHGSGPLDRNENTSLGKLNVFNVLAHTLAENGIASLRYDKRGCGKSGGKYFTTGHFELVDDAENALNFLKQQSHVLTGPLYIAGHSEGTIIAPQIANHRTDLAGIILLAPFLQKLDKVLMQQAAHMSADIKTMPGFGGAISRFVVKLLGGVEKQQVQFLEKLQNSTADVIRLRFQRVPAKWLRELIALNPEPVYQQVKLPTLIIAGSKDLQCAPEDAEQIARIIGEKCQLHMIANLTHILRLDQAPASFSAYKKLLKQPIDPIIGELMVGWINQVSNQQLK